MEDHLRDVYEVLKEKQIALQRLTQEVEALRLACPLLLDEGDSVTPVVGMQQQESNRSAQTSNEVAASLEAIRIQLVAALPADVAPQIQKSVLLKFRETALGVSHKLLKRVRDSRLLESEFQRKSVRDLFERFSNAA